MTSPVSLAEQNLDRKNSSAVSCLNDAQRLTSQGNTEAANRRALRSLGYSIGILHAAYSQAFALSGISGPVRLVS